MRVLMTQCGAAALATASGQLLGVPIGASFFAEIGTSHQVSIRVTREP